MRTTGQSTTGYPWHHWFDWCATPLKPVSRHTYSYSMGMGDAWTVKVAGELSGRAIARRELEPLGIPEGTPYQVQTWRGGTAYHYGLSPPRYPVPTCIGFCPSRYGVYLFDTVKGYDGMPLFRGYTWKEWNAS